MEDRDWEVIYFAQGMVPARIVAGRLEAEGIPTKLRYEAVGALYGLTLDGLGEVKVLVPRNALLLARSVLSRSYDEEDLAWEDKDGEKDRSAE